MTKKFPSSPVSYTTCYYNIIIIIILHVVCVFRISVQVDQAFGTCVKFSKILDRSHVFMNQIYHLTFIIKFLFYLRQLFNAHVSSFQVSRICPRNPRLCIADCVSRVLSQIMLDQVVRSGKEHKVIWKCKT